MSQRMNLYCKLVPVQYREYEYGLLKTRAETCIRVEHSVYGCITA